MPPKYSIIVPVYNAENTLRRCVDSLLSERYSDREIILVNDGSRDRSGDICREYAAKDQKTLYIEKENGGVSTARNAGLDVASGEYILFVDSDDYVVPGFFSSIDKTLKETPADFIQFSFRYDCDEKTIERVIKPVSAQSREALMPNIIDAICRKTINGPVAKLYKRELIETNQIRFPVGASVGEDRVFNIVYSFFIQSYLASSVIVYVVDTNNEHSLSRRRHENLQQQFDIADNYFFQALKAAPLSLHEKICYRKAVNFGICRGIYHDAKLLHQDHISWFARLKQLRQLCDTINHQHLDYPNTRYCRWISLPVQLRLTPLIDIIAWKLLH